MRLAAVFALAVVAAVPAAAPADANAGPQPLVRKINKVRQAHGLRPLRESRSLKRSANGYARHMLRTGRFGHAARIRASSRFKRLGEVLARQRGWRPKPAMTIRQWMNSPVHRALILSPGFRYLGAGRARGRLGRGRTTLYVVQFGRL